MLNTDFVLAYVTVPMIATGLLLWAKLRRIVIILETKHAEQRPPAS